MFSIKIFLSAILIIILYYLNALIQCYCTFERNKKKIAHIKGPKPLPLLGNLLDFPRDYKEHSRFLCGLAAKYTAMGEDVLRLWIGPSPFVYPLNHEAVSSITSSVTELSKGQSYEMIRRWLGDGLITVDGAHSRWHRNRKMLTPAFHFVKLDEYSELMCQHAEHFVHYLQKFANGEILDMYEMIKMCTLDIIVESAMGTQLNALEHSDQPYVKAVEEFNYLVYKNTMSPAVRIPFVWQLCGYEAWARRCLRTLKGMTARVVAERLERRKEQLSEEKARPDFLDLLLNRVDDGAMPMEEICEEVDTFLFAGHDTTSHTLTWILWALATNPDVQDRLYDELCVAFPNRTGIAEIKKRELRYMEAVIKETMRYFSPVPFTERQLQNDLQIGKTLVPKGVTVVLPFMVLHRDPKVFANPYRFDPNHFIDREYPATAFMPFSAGPRNCIGQKFAMSEVRILLAHLVLNYTFRADHQMDENWPKMEVISKPSMGLPVRITLRD